MFVRRFFVCLTVLNVVFARNLPQNETSIVTTYAKVANFGGTGSPNINEGRSSGMSLYTQSSHAKVISGQNLKSRLSYYTSKPSRLGQGVTEMFPSKGEVQERFNPRPYFDYLHVQPKRHQTSSSSSGSSKPSPVYGTPFDSFPVFRGSDPSPTADAKPSEFSGPSVDSYSPMMNGNGEKESENSMMFPMDSYQPTKEDNAKPTQNGNDYPGFPYAPPDDGGSEDQAMPPSKEAPSESMSDGDSEMAMEKDPKGNHNDYSHYQDVGPMIVHTVRPPGPVGMHYHDHPPSGYYNHEDNGGMNGNDNGGGMDMGNGGGGMDMENGGGGMDSGGGTDMDMPKGYPQLPEYIDHPPKDHYPHFFYDHHPVYHEITTTTTTTTEAPQERVNNNYSYYYLGRKLWYIPLYFSAYFIIYITVLILKSIARHKVSFWHDLHNLGNRREGRNLNLEEITSNVTSSIERAQAKYMM